MSGPHMDVEGQLEELRLYLEQINREIRRLERRAEGKFRRPTVAPKSTLMTQPFAKADHAGSQPSGI